MANQDEMLRMLDSRIAEQQTPAQEQQTMPYEQFFANTPRVGPPPVITPKRSYPRKKQQQSSALADVQALKQQVAAKNGATNPEDLLERGMLRVPEGVFLTPALNQFNIHTLLPDKKDKGVWDPSKYSQEELQAIMEYLGGKYGAKHVDALNALADGKMRGMEKSQQEREARDAQHDASWGAKIKAKQHR